VLDKRQQLIQYNRLDISGFFLFYVSLDLTQTPIIQSRNEQTNYSFTIPIVFILIVIPTRFLVQVKTMYYLTHRFSKR